MQELRRHGDLMIIPCDKIPTEAKQLKTNILEHGESGHNHTLANALIYEHKGTKFINAEQDTELSHEEHKTIPIHKGLYKVNIEQEYDPIQEIVNKVRD